ncbi:MAG: hypothetical protein MUF35_00635 [Candidatus Nanopelagicales bacterium]|jgi:hypothetical protein|nr:hypothetical protein [Candidatus Nanopelagicales bacterium]
MAAPERGADQPRRRFITRTHVEDAAAAGQSVRVGPRDVVTDEAAQRAEDLGVAIERDRGAAVPGSGVGAGGLRRAVRAAVIAELGHEPARLDQVIDDVLRARSLA